ncbi:MAG: hypothetical protein AB7O59_13045 [Pirellulales bacterium]
MGFATLRYLYLAYLSKPVGDRIVYRAIRKVAARRILEIGIGSADRTVRMVKLAQNGAGAGPVRYAAIDLFEGRSADMPPGLSLKETHRLLAPCQAQVQLIPGTAGDALQRAANSLANMDLVIISAEHDTATIGGGWFYVPRMLHANSRVYLETRGAEGQRMLRLMSPAEIGRLAAECRPRRAA